MSKHRIFVAVLLPTKMQKRLSEYTKKWSELKVRWYRPEDLHITLVPPWMETDVNAVLQRLTEVSGRFSCQFKKISFGPTKQKPRLLWADVKKNPDLTRLYDRTHHILNKDKEDRPFKPHVTLGRFKPSDYHQFKIKEIEEAIDWTMEITEVAVMESPQTSGQEKGYKILGRVKL